MPSAANEVIPDESCLPSLLRAALYASILHCKKEVSHRCSMCYWGGCPYARASAKLRLSRESRTQATSQAPVMALAQDRRSSLLRGLYNFFAPFVLREATAAHSLQWQNWLTHSRIIVRQQRSVLKISHKASQNLDQFRISFGKADQRGYWRNNFVDVPGIMWHGLPIE